MVNSFSAWSSDDTLSSRERSAWPWWGWGAARRKRRRMWRRRNWTTYYWGPIWRPRVPRYCPLLAAELLHCHCPGWGVAEGTPGGPGGAQVAGWAACSCHSAPWSWLAAAGAAGGGRCYRYCPATVTSRRIAGTNPHPDGSPTGRPAGDETTGSGQRRTPRSRWRLQRQQPPPPPPQPPLPPLAPGRTSIRRRESRSCRSTLSSAFPRGEVAASACASPVLVENHCRKKTIWYRWVT